MTIDYWQTAEYNTRCICSNGQRPPLRSKKILTTLTSLKAWAIYMQGTVTRSYSVLSSSFRAIFWLGTPHRFVPPYTLPTMTNIRYAVGLPPNNPLCHQLKHQLTSFEAAALTSTANTRKSCQTNPDGDTEQIWIPEVSSVPLYNYPKNTPQP